MNIDPNDTHLYDHDQIEFKLDTVYEELDYRKTLVISNLTDELYGMIRAICDHKDYITIDRQIALTNTIMFSGDVTTLLRNINSTAVREGGIKYREEYKILAVEIDYELQSHLHEELETVTYQMIKQGFK